MPMRFSPTALLVMAACTLTGCNQCSKDAQDSAMPGAEAPAGSAELGTEVTESTEATPNEAALEAAATEAVGTLQIIDVVEGKGAVAEDGKKLTVHYTGTLNDGTKFDSSKDRGTPFTFTLGSGMVIAGWDQGVKGMKEGGSRKLVIPPQLAYGDRAVSVIPPNSTLNFEIELLKVE